jgi:hypothetical protein
VVGAYVPCLFQPVLCVMSHQPPAGQRPPSPRLHSAVSEGPRSAAEQLINRLGQLKASLRQIKYPLTPNDCQMLTTGKPVYFLPILHFIFLAASHPFSLWLTTEGYSLVTKNDYRFVEVVFRIMVRTSRALLLLSPSLS